MLLFCGTGSFKDVDKAPEAAVKKKKRAGGGGSKKENPYASRGLEKFSTVVSELESRRERILRRVGPVGDGGGNRVLVRFVQSEAKGWVPIVVKLPPEEEQQKRRAGCKKRKQAASTASSSPQSTPPPSEPASPREDAKLSSAAAAEAPARKKAAGAGAGAGERWSWSWGKSVRPQYYMPFVAVLLLVSLVVFGRVFAICCTSVWWYLVPILSGANGGAGSEARGGVRRSTAKTGKVLAKKASDKKLPTPLPPSHGKRGSCSSGVHELLSPRSHPHGKKG
ncbi:hypothetical protein GUJ93_ZPchr0007g6382 [Zizania palustris]|uniref:ZCF37 n=1 Tax=Zizania palustris TaxID=103762 RepID=A0A8J5TE13_ZIZPA|nr:hypothetical protein GUJ93_ZPchr0007g6382 [Zizania palustris]